MKTTTEEISKLNSDYANTWVEPITNVSEIDIEEELKNGTIEKIEPVSETVEEAAKKYANGISNASIEEIKMAKCDFTHGANWQKQQSDTIINSLTEKLDNSEANVYMYKTVLDDYFDKFCKGQDIIKELADNLNLVMLLTIHNTDKEAVEMMDEAIKSIAKASEYLNK